MRDPRSDCAAVSACLVTLDVYLNNYPRYDAPPLVLAEMLIGTVGSMTRMWGCLIELWVWAYNGDVTAASATALQAVLQRCSAVQLGAANGTRQLQQHNIHKHYENNLVQQCRMLTVLLQQAMHEAASNDLRTAILDQVQCVRVCGIQLLQSQALEVNMQLERGCMLAGLATQLRQHLIVHLSQQAAHLQRVADDELVQQQHQQRHQQRHQQQQHQHQHQQSYNQRRKRNRCYQLTGM